MTKLCFLFGEVLHYRELFFPTVNLTRHSGEYRPSLKQRRVGVCVRIADSTISARPIRILFVFLKNKETK